MEHPKTGIFRDYFGFSSLGTFSPCPPGDWPSWYQAIEAWQQPVHVADVADAVVACVQRPDLVNRNYILSGQHPISSREMVFEAATAIGIRPLIVNLPVAPLHGFARFLEALRVPLPFRSEQILRLAEDKNFSHEIADQDLGFRPRSFSQGVREQVAATRLQF